MSNINLVQNGSIFMVNDSLVELKLLASCLDFYGIKVKFSSNGKEAIEKLSQFSPEVILLDVSMPDMDGFETCKQLQKNPNLQEIPVIFLTTFAEKNAQVEQIYQLGVDYIIKPIQPPEVIAKISLHWPGKSFRKTRDLPQNQWERKNPTLSLTNLEDLPIDSEQNIKPIKHLAPFENLPQELLQELGSAEKWQILEVQLRSQIQWLENKLREFHQTRPNSKEKRQSLLVKLIAGLAHEINTPVNFIYGNLNHAREYLEDLLHLLTLYRQTFPYPGAEINQEIEAIDLEFLMSDLPKLFRSMKMGVDRIREIVQSLRIFSRIDEAEIKLVDIHEEIESTLLMLHQRLKATDNRPGIAVYKKYEKLPQIACYPTQLKQVFINLLTNAIDALEESFVSRNLSVTCVNQEQGLSQELSKIPAIEIRTEILPGGRVGIRIADNGPGIPEEVQNRLFDPFFTTKPIGKGTGIGLSISYQIVVEKHQGNLWCISTPGQGAEFIVEIPMQLDQEFPTLNR